MPLDHYISQVHLKKFNSPALGDRMYAIRKSDLKAFTPNSRVVCVVNDGSTNAYLLEDRAIEKFSGDNRAEVQFRSREANGPEN